MNRIDGRANDQLRPFTFDLGIAPHAGGSVLVNMGNTRVICGVTVEESVPRWMKEQGAAGGWLTAEYSMLPYSTQPRKPRDIAKGRIDGRSMEIQRLIGRSLRAVVDLAKLGPRTIWVDCDVVATEDGEFVEVQGSGEEATFAQSQLDEMLALGRKGIAELIAAQRAVLARLMVTPPAS